MKSLAQGLKDAAAPIYPCPCLRVLSDMQTSRKYNRVSFAISGQVCRGTSIASYLVRGGPEKYKLEALARLTWQYISKVRTYKEDNRNDRPYSNNVLSSNLLTARLHPYFATISYEKTSLL